MLSCLWQRHDTGCATPKTTMHFFHSLFALNGSSEIVPSLNTQRTHLLITQCHDANSRIRTRLVEVTREHVRHFILSLSIFQLHFKQSKCRAVSECGQTVNFGICANSRRQKVAHSRYKIQYSFNSIYHICCNEHVRRMRTILSVFGVFAPLRFPTVTISVSIPLSPIFYILTICC